MAEVVADTVAETRGACELAGLRAACLLGGALLGGVRAVGVAAAVAGDFAADRGRSAAELARDLAQRGAEGELTADLLALDDGEALQALAAGARRDPAALAEHAVDARNRALQTTRDL